jgi:hypothetical protein
MFLDHFLHAIPPSPQESSLDEYCDDGVYLGDPNDPEDQADALRHIQMLGPVPAAVEF